MSTTNNIPSQFWDSRFAEPGFMYGTEPNVFFKSILDTLKPGKIFVPGAGEGRDGVYAATTGWDVVCADQSIEGQRKSLSLADEKKVAIRYDVGDIDTAQYRENEFDAIAAVFFHLPSPIRRRFFENAIKWLKPGGVFIIQMFTPRQLNFSSGGPKDNDMLLEPNEMIQYQPWLNIEVCQELEIVLDEGAHHSGPASVVEFVAIKK